MKGIFYILICLILGILLGGLIAFKIVPYSMTLARIIWFSLGVIGNWLLRKNCAYFYYQRNLLWNIFTFMYYILIGPLVFTYGISAAIIKRYPIK
jgi:hypothetical protein